MYNPEMIGQFLEQLRWELVAEEACLQSKDGKIHFEISETATRAVNEGGGFLIPNMKMFRPDGMSQEDFDTAQNMVKDGLVLRRQTQLDALDVVIDLFREICFSEQGEVILNAGNILENSEGDSDA